MGDRDETPPRTAGVDHADQSAAETGPLRRADRPPHRRVRPGGVPALQRGIPLPPVAARPGVEELGPDRVRAQPLSAAGSRRSLPRPGRGGRSAARGVARPLRPRRHPLHGRETGAGDHRAGRGRDVRDHQPSHPLYRDHRAERSGVRSFPRRARLGVPGRSRRRKDPVGSVTVRVSNLIDHLAGEMEKLRQAGTYKEELVLQTPQDARVRVGGRDVIMLTSNNYLGFANHPRVREAQKKAIDRWGAGMASVRFICGTEELHKELEAEIAGFFGRDDSILYMSCWNANEGLFAAVLDEPDGLYSDELNHASIIDGVRLCKAKRFRVPHNDMAAFERMLSEDTTSRFRLMITDGVFSMEGEEANLHELVRICEEKGTLLAVDDSHATGVLGATGRGTAEEQGVFDRIPVTTGTLGKAMGSAAGGFVAGPKALVETLRQRSRTYLFSNSLPPAVAAGSL